MFPNYNFNNIRSEAILTDAYVAATIIENAQNYSRLVIDAYFTIGSLTDCQIKIETSWDGVKYTQETASSISGGVNTNALLVHKLAATGNYEIIVPITARFIKISAIGTGTATSSKLELDARLSNVE